MPSGLVAVLKVAHEVVAREPHPVEAVLLQHFAVGGPQDRGHREVAGWVAGNEDRLVEALPGHTVAALGVADAVVLVRGAVAARVPHPVPPAFTTMGAWMWKESNLPGRRERSGLAGWRVQACLVAAPSDMACTSYQLALSGDYSIALRKAEIRPPAPLDSGFRRNHYGLAQAT